MELLRVKGRVVGSINNGVFIKKVRASVHKLHTPPAWAIDAALWHDIAGKVHTIVIEDTETDTRYIMSAKNFALKMRLIDRGHGKQYMVLESDFKYMDSQQGELF